MEEVLITNAMLVMERDGVNMSKIVFTDLETGGLFYYPRVINGSLRPMNPIIQIGCAVVDCDTLDIVDTLEMKVAFNEAEGEQSAYAINGYKKENWVDAPSKVVAKARLTEFFKKHATVTKISKRTNNPYTVALLGGQNIAAFDMPFLRNWYEPDFFPVDYHTVDTMALAHIYSIVTGTRLDSLGQEALSKHFGVAFDGKAHDALADVKVTAGIYKAMMMDLKGRMNNTADLSGRVTPHD